MTLNAKDYKGLRRDQARDQALARALRKIPEAQRFEFIEEYLTFDPIIGLELAVKCLRTPARCASGLEQAFRGWGRGAY